ncbi:MAG: hypothetical protein H6799_01935 [Candidatus Nomurabacteria bacterium]|nr:MAG: hypothetical protein H6799_01935 [Candidatus Nomurabacteria bacterium]HRV76434.1 hypothetical protein [Candidatus Saccharimonadales bacterium]
MGDFVQDKAGATGEITCTFDRDGNYLGSSVLLPPTSLFLRVFRLFEEIPVECPEVDIERCGRCPGIRDRNINTSGARVVTATRFDDSVRDMLLP